MTAPLPIILDCDPGIDDAMAILLALGAPEKVEIRAITCVNGNVGSEQTAINARRILELANRRDIPVHRGSFRPIMYAKGARDGVHGNDGLGGLDLPAPTMKLEDEHAVDAIIRIARSEPGGITLCPTGPLTNVALALLKDPELPRFIKRIVLMGGSAFQPGNVTPLAEFNFHVDPHAARIVYEAGIPITMFGLDVTSHATLGPDFGPRLKAEATALAEPVMTMLSGYKVAEIHLHDACVIAELIDPTIFTRQSGHVRITTSHGAAGGQSVARVKPRHMEGYEPNCEIVTAVESAKLEDMLVASLAQVSSRL